MITRLSKIVLLVCLLCIISFSQEVIKISKAYGSLEEQIKSTYEAAREYDDFWIAYSIETKNKFSISVGSFLLFDKDLKISLGDIIEMTPRYIEFKKSYLNSKNNRNGRAVHVTNGRFVSDEEADKETAILFRYDRNSTDISDFAEIAICNMAQYIDLDGIILYWLDKKDAAKSAEFVTTMFEKNKSWFTKEELVSAIGIHAGQPKVLPILKNIIYGNEKEDMKEDALFWLGVQNTNEAFSILKNVINDDKFGELREDALMSLGNMDLEQATDELIKIAKTNKDDNLREHAIYGLGNKAVKKAEEALKDFVENDPDIEIKKRAIYALADRSEENIPYLIKIAKTHKSLTIRKTAIYSLSNYAEDESAVEALIDLARGK